MKEAIFHPSTLRLTFSGSLPGKGRPRFDPRTRRVYTDSKTAKAERTLRLTAQAAVGTIRLEGPLMVLMELGVAVPKSWSRVKRAKALSGALPPTCRPDVDNVVKLVLDALNGVVWKDDAQVCELHVKRLYMAEPETRLVVGALYAAAETAERPSPTIMGDQT